MRLHAAFHIAGIAAFVICFLLFISSALNTFLEDTGPYVLSKEELEPQQYYSEDRYEVPKILHQVYLGWDNLPMPVQWEESQQSCIEKNPNFKYIFWDNITARGLLEKEYPWFLPTYDNYKFPIQRADSIRYFILYHYGGIYVDLDNGCRRSLDPLRAFPAWMPGTTNHIGLTNHIMGTKRKHPYFQLLISSLPAYNHDWILPYMTIMNSAGPHFVSMVWEHYVKSNPHPHPEDVRILMQEEYHGYEWSFFTKKEGGTWHHWDTQAFAWAGQHLFIVGFLSLCGLFGVVACFWYLGWKLALLLERKITDGYAPAPLLPWQKSD